MVNGIRTDDQSDVRSWLCKMYWCREIRNTGDSPLFRYETFINFLSLVFRHKERERHNFYYADCIIWPNKRAAHPVANAGLARPRVGSQLTSFLKSPNSQPIASGQDVIHTPVLFPIWVFFIMTFVIVLSAVRERELYSMFVHRIVQSPTKPNDKI